jgi:hypothetical protein
MKRLYICANVKFCFLVIFTIFTIILYSTDMRNASGNSFHCDSWFYFGLALSPEVASWQSGSSMFYIPTRIMRYLPQSVIYSTFDFLPPLYSHYLLLFISILTPIIIYFRLINRVFNFSKSISWMLSTVLVLPLSNLALNGNNYNLLDQIYVSMGIYFIFRMIPQALSSIKSKFIMFYIGNFAIYLYFYNAIFLLIFIMTLSCIIIFKIFDKNFYKVHGLLLYFVLGLSSGIVLVFLFYFMITGVFFPLNSAMNQINFFLMNQSGIERIDIFSKSILMSQTFRYFLATVILSIISLILILKRNKYNHSFDYKFFIIPLLNIVFAVCTFYFINLNLVNSFFDFQASPYRYFLLCSFLIGIYYLRDLSSIQIKNFNYLTIIIFIFFIISLNWNVYLNFYTFFTQLNFVGSLFLYAFLTIFAFLIYFFKTKSLLIFFIFIVYLGSSLYLFNGNYSNSVQNRQSFSEHYLSVFSFHSSLRKLVDLRTEFYIYSPLVDTSVSNTETAVFRSLFGAAFRQCTFTELSISNLNNVISIS